LSKARECKKQRQSSKSEIFLYPQIKAQDSLNAEGGLQMGLLRSISTCPIFHTIPSLKGSRNAKGKTTLGEGSVTEPVVFLAFSFISLSSSFPFSFPRC
jgi:hypothetical protein